METIGGILTVSVTDDTQEIMISHAASGPDADEIHKIVIMPRYARHLAHVLIECAGVAEAESRAKKAVQPRGPRFKPLPTAQD